MNGESHFAPAARDSEATIAKQTKLVTRRFAQTLDHLPDMTAVLNGRRQIVYANRALKAVSGPDNLSGLRPGEALRCRNVSDAPAGCGTSRQCRFCGAVRAILEAQHTNEPTQQECCIPTTVEGRSAAVEMRVSVVPFQIGDEWYQIVTFSDIAAEKHRAAIERVFFHDVLNTASGIHATVSLLDDASDGQERDELMSVLSAMVDGLIDEIKGQRMLVAAENGTLSVDLEEFRTRWFLDRLVQRFSHYRIADEKSVEIAYCEDVAWTTDATILGRVLGNLIKNGLEAGGSGNWVTVGCRAEDESVIFTVANPAVMREDTQLQLFNRRFSTKGKDRGLGTYSVKLLTETYLGGTVSFVSRESEGTIFSLRIPKAPPQRHQKRRQKNGGMDT